MGRGRKWGTCGVCGREMGGNFCSLCNPMTSSGEIGAAIAALSYGLCYRLRFSLPEEVRNLWMRWRAVLRAVTKADAERRWKHQGGRGGEGGKSGQDRSGKGSILLRKTRHRLRRVLYVKIRPTFILMPVGMSDPHTQNKPHAKTIAYKNPNPVGVGVGFSCRRLNYFFLNFNHNPTLDHPERPW